MSIKRPRIKLDNLRLFDKIGLGDVWYTSTGLLLNFQGLNGSTIINDRSKFLHTISPVNGAQIVTNQFKFGNSSLLLDGVNDYLDVANHDSLDLSSADFTIECWFRVNNTLTGAYGTLFDKADGGGAGSGPYWIFIRNNSGVLSVGTSISTYNGGSWANWDIINNAYLATINVDTWYHYALVRHGSTFTVYLDGTSVGTGTDSDELWPSSHTLSIGARQQNTKSWYFGGNIDEVRITRGVARYTSNFTPPLQELPDSPGDVNKKVVIDEEAKGLAIGEGGVDESRLAHAWVIFDGHDPTIGYPKIIDSYNILAVADTGVGKYTITISQPSASTNRCVTATVQAPDYVSVVLAAAGIPGYSNPRSHPATDQVGVSTLNHTENSVDLIVNYGATPNHTFDSERISVIFYAH